MPFFFLHIPIQYIWPLRTYNNVCFQFYFICRIIETDSWASLLVAFFATENIVLSSAWLLLLLYVQLYRQDHTEQETE